VESAKSCNVKYEDPFNFSPNDEEEESWRSALFYTIGVLIMLILGLLGNGAFK
jgi:hypothetical protein